MDVLLNKEQIKQTIGQLSSQIAESIPSDFEAVVIGIRSRGEIIANRVSEQLADKLKKPVPCGVLDITLYRDDLNNPQSGGSAVVRSTEIAFDINDKIIILIDDVLHTGRSTRAAMDALIDLGRPKAIRLAVLVERAGREFPIQADFTGLKADVAKNKNVQVYMADADDKEQVVVV